MLKRGRMIVRADHMMGEDGEAHTVATTEEDRIVSPTLKADRTIAGTQNPKIEIHPVAEETADNRILRKEFDTNEDTEDIGVPTARIKLHPKTSTGHQERTLQKKDLPSSIGWDSPHRPKIRSPPCLQMLIKLQFTTAAVLCT
jgi:hypothetical protein